ncbi:MAG: hypothetical protein U0228_01635 [Myxococcaceae bacterium]
MLRGLKFVAVALLLSACGPDNVHQQSLGRSTGFFNLFYPSDPFCQISGDNGLELSVLFVFHPDRKMEDKDSLKLYLRPLPTADEHYVFETGLEYGAIGETANAVVEIERGHERVNPDLTGQVAADALASRTNLYFPLWLHKVRITGRRLCNRDVLTSELNLDDCIDVPDSSLDDGKLWCSVGVLVDPGWTQ